MKKTLPAVGMVLGLTGGVIWLHFFLIENPVLAVAGGVAWAVLGIVVGLLDEWVIISRTRRNEQDVIELYKANDAKIMALFFRGDVLKLPRLKPRRTMFYLVLYPAHVDAELVKKEIRGEASEEEGALLEKECLGMVRFPAYKLAVMEHKTIILPSEVLSALRAAGRYENFLSRNEFLTDND